MKTPSRRGKIEKKNHLSHFVPNNIIYNETYCPNLSLLYRRIFLWRPLLKSAKFRYDYVREEIEKWLALNIIKKNLHLRDSL